MGYNYATAFIDVDPDTVKEASVVALLNIRDEFPDCGPVKVQFLTIQHLFLVTSGTLRRVYSLEELGFKA